MYVFSSVAQSCLTLQPHELQHARPPCPSPTPGVHPNSSIESVMPSNHLILCRPLLLPPIFPSIRVFPNESVLRIRWSKYWSFSFNISASNEYSGLISFRTDYLQQVANQIQEFWISALVMSYSYLAFWEVKEGSCKCWEFLKCMLCSQIKSI